MSGISRNTSIGNDFPNRKEPAYLLRKDGRHITFSSMLGEARARDGAKMRWMYIKDTVIAFRIQSSFAATRMLFVLVGGRKHGQALECP